MSIISKIHATDKSCKKHSELCEQFWDKYFTKVGKSENKIVFAWWAHIWHNFQILFEKCTTKCSQL